MHNMLLSLLAQVKYMLGSSRESETLIEENTHIAYLCDLLERIWGHGLKKREVPYGKSDSTVDDPKIVVGPRIVVVF